MSASHKKGFTLIELLVAITIGAIILTSALGVYAQFVQTKLQIEIARQMQKEINFSLARLTDRVRNCTITDPTSNNDDTSSSITVQCKDNEAFVFEFIDNEFLMKESPLLSHNKFTVDTDDESDTKSYFKVNNSSDDAQPKVQIFMTVQSKQDPKVSQTIRTTISSRKYNF